MLYSVIASFPLFFAGGFAIRLQEDLGINKSQFGLAVAAYFITSTIASFTIGSWIDRRGARVGFIMAGIGGSIASVIVALSNSFWPFAIGLAVAGLSNTAGQLGGNRVLAGLGPERQGAGFGVKQAAVPMGSFLAGVAVSTIGSGLDWRAAFFGYSVLALASVTIAPTGPGAASASEPRRPVGDDWPFLLTLASAGMLGGATGNGLAVLTVDAFGAAGFAENVGATALAIGSAITIVARTGLGWFAGRRKATGFVELGTAMGIGAIAFVIMATAGTNQVLIWVGSLLAFLGAWGWPGVMYYTIVRNARTTPGTATGFVVTGVFLGGILGAPLLAVIADRWSYQSAWTTAATMSFVATGLIVLASQISASSHRTKDP